MFIRCKRCGKEYTKRRDMLVEKVGNHIKASCSCGGFLKFLKWKEREVVKIDEVFSIETIAFAIDKVMLFTIKSNPKIDFPKIDFGVKIMNVNGEITYFDLSGNIKPIPKDIAEKAANILAASVKHEFPEVATDVFSNCFDFLTLDNSNSILVYTAMARQLAQSAIKCSMPIAA